ncbi:MAG: 50S ribosomal protein L11 methyltransferase, partial [Desulfobacterales bacterium]|nr:50S ribosomal protein L11 methyltransferase [Desulfobacterales bacterium]
MKWIAVKVLFEFQDRALATDLIAACFYTLGVKGVVIDDPVADPDEDWGTDVLPLPEKDAVTGYLPLDRRFENALAFLQESLGKLERATGVRCRVVCSEIDEEDWAHAWKAFFHPERVGRHMVVKPTWRDYIPQPGDKVLEIDPGMAFGTGTHPTTSLCIALMEKYLRPGCSFLDVGTGSGILMVAAAKLGAGQGLGIDNDPLAVEIAGNNLLLNAADPEKFKVNAGDLVTVVTGSYDLVVANILSEVIVLLLDDLPEKISPGGLVITSGIITKNQSAVTDKIASQ